METKNGEKVIEKEEEIANTLYSKKLNNIFFNKA